MPEPFFVRCVRCRRFVVVRKIPHDTDAGNVFHKFKVISQYLCDNGGAVFLESNNSPAVPTAVCSGFPIERGNPFNGDNCGSVVHNMEL